MWLLSDQFIKSCIKWWGLNIWTAWIPGVFPYGQKQDSKVFSDIKLSLDRFVDKLKHVLPTSCPVWGGGYPCGIFGRKPSHIAVSGPGCLPSNINTAPSLQHIAAEVAASPPLTRCSTVVTPLYLCADNEEDSIKEMMEGEGTELQG